MDIKQLLTYAALNFASGGKPLTMLGLFNPRMGTSFKAGIDDICYETAGSSAVELLQEIVRTISGGGLSR
jgi:hypothetical protein